MSCKYNERVEIGKAPDGSPIYRWASGNSKQELHMNIAKLFIEAQTVTDTRGHTETGTHNASEQQECVQAKHGRFFEVYAKEWLETFKLNGLEEKTKPVYKSRMNNLIIPAFSGMLLDEITSSGIQKWLNKLRDDGKAKSTIRDTLNLLKQCLAAAVDDGLIGKNPSDSERITNPSKKVNKREALTDEQWLDVVQNIARLKDANDRRFMAILSYTSLRPGEVYGLRWEDFDQENKVINIERAIAFANNHPIVKGPKTEAGVRLIPLPDALAEFLAPFGCEGYVIARENGDPYTEQAHRCAWKRIKTTINLYGMTPYNWRHTYATTMIHSGVDLDTAKAIMGHADMRMTMKYVHTQPQHIAKAADIMNAHFVQSASGMWTKNVVKKCSKTLMP